MLRELTNLVGFNVAAKDGPVGRVRDVIVDDSYWIIRSVVVETLPDLGGHTIHVSPVAMNPPQWKERVLPLTITREEARRLPCATDTDQTDSGEARFWSSRFAWPLWVAPDFPPEETRPEPANGGAGVPESGAEEEENPGRSGRAMSGYRVRAVDGDVGKLRDFLVSDVKWVVRYLLIEVGTWPFRKKVMVVPEQVERVSRSTGRVYLHLRSHEVRESQAYDQHGALRPSTVIDQNKVAAQGRARGAS